MSRLQFDTFFQSATHNWPYDYQCRLACGEDACLKKSETLVTGRECHSLLINIPTGLGKTAAVVLAWLWNRVQPQNPKWPRRLVYCLPMRTLVEQTRDRVSDWLKNLAKAFPETENLGLQWLLKHSPVVLMGGEENDQNKAEWDIHPEHPAILIGTQDMLLSRALNRGYALSRNRWPMHFGLLNNDCLWVMDEIQLMGPGLGTACQLEAFREALVDFAKTAAPSRNRNATWYVSATAHRALVISREWRSKNGDHRPPDKEFVIKLGLTEHNDRDGQLGRRRLAVKALAVHTDWHFADEVTQTRIVSEHAKMIAAVKNARDVPRRTLVICNTVRKAHELFAGLEKAVSQKSDSPDIVLLHSRFRRRDREDTFQRIERPTANPSGQIVVATQVVEAGVDISSAVLWTEATTLPSMVQRAGRLNRAGEFGHDRKLKGEWQPIMFVVGVGVKPPPVGKKEKGEEKEKRERENAKCYLPYDHSECEAALIALSTVLDASPATLEIGLVKPLTDALKPPVGTLQRHELLDFFDTDANLSLGYADATPFVRGIDLETDVQVLWRSWKGDQPPYLGDIGADELCSVPLWELRKLGGWRQGFVWQGRERGWQPASDRNVFPGAVLLLPVSAGGYSSSRGWTGNPADKDITDLYEPSPLPSDADLLSMLDGAWESIGLHTRKGKGILRDILKTVGIDPETGIGAAMLHGMDWHDFGKNHPDWQAAVAAAAVAAGVTPDANQTPFAKFSLAQSPSLVGKAGWELRAEVYRLKRTFRPGLWHEVASALVLRQHHHHDGRAPSNEELLAEYLVMSHHGRVRKVLRDSLPKKPKPGEPVFNEVCGITEGAQIGAVTVEGCSFTAVPISIECRQLGRCGDGSEGWTKGVLRLLDAYSPFCLAYYETLFRAADWRASQKPS